MGRDHVRPTMTDNPGFDLDNIRQLVRQGIPHVRALGVDVESVEVGKMTVRLDYQARLVGNPETGVLHGGVITTLLDTVSGLAVHAALQKFLPIATLDLRIDYLRPATPGRTLFAFAHCYKLTRNVAFTRGVAYHDDIDDPIANTAGSFMLSTSGPAMGGKRKAKG